MKTIYVLYAACGMMLLAGLSTGTENQIAGSILWAIIIAIVHAVVVSIQKRKS